MEYNYEYNFQLIEEEIATLKEKGSFDYRLYKKQFNSEFWKKYKNWKNGIELDSIKKRGIRGAKGRYAPTLIKLSNIIQDFTKDHIAGATQACLKKKYQLSHYSYKLCLELMETN